MAEMEESAMEDENNVTSNVTSDAGTEAEPQEDLVPKRGLKMEKISYQPDNGNLQNVLPTSY